MFRIPNDSRMHGVHGDVSVCKKGWKSVSRDVASTVTDDACLRTFEFFGHFASHHDQSELALTEGLVRSVVRFDIEIVKKYFAYVMGLSGNVDYPASGSGFQLRH